MSKQDKTADGGAGLTIAGQMLDVLRSGIAAKQAADTPARPHTEDEKTDAAATLAAYNELPPEYQDAVVESFLNRVDQQMAKRNAAVAAQNWKSNDVARKNTSYKIATLAICLGAAIPLSAIAGGMFGLVGLMVAWVGIVIIAVVLGLGFGDRRK